MRNVILGTMLASVGSLCAAELIREAPLFIWNKTDSIETGLYWHTDSPIRTGSIVAVMPKEIVRRLLVERDYLPENVPLLKRVFAENGQQICRVDDKIIIDNFVVAATKKHDRNGRKIPIWEGCFTLKKDQFFLLNAHPDSLDGRYFGATDVAEIIGTYQKM